MAISHVKSVTIADWVGTVTVGNSTGGTQTVNASDLARPTDWNSVHNQYSTISGNTAGVSTVSGTNIVLAGGNNVTLSANGSTISVHGQGTAGLISAINASAGTTSNNLTNIVLSNSNGLSFGLAGSTITASHNGLTSQSNQALSGSNGSFAFQTATFGNLNGMSFYTSNGSMVGSYTVPTQTNQTLGGYFVGNTTGQSSSSTWDARTLSIDGAGIVSAGWSNGTMRISATQSNQAFSADASSTFQTLSLQNSNGISFSNNAGAVRLTHDLQFTSATSAITSAALHTSVGGRIYVTAQSTGQSSSSSYDLRTLSIVPDGIISAGWSNGSFRISATQSNQAFSAGAASSTFQTLSFQDSNGLSFSNNAGAIRVSYTRNVASNAIQAVGSATGSGTNTSRFAADDHVHAGVFSVGVSNAGNTAGDTRVDVGRFVLAGGANITLSQATAAGALNTISIVGATAAAAPVNFSAGTTSNNLGSVVFSNSNGVTFGLNGSTITASINAGGGGVTLSNWPPAPWGWSTAASTIYSGSTSANGASTHSTMSYYVNLLALPAPVSVSKIKGIFSVNTGAAGTGSATVRHYFGLYTKNGDSLSLYSSWIAGIVYSQSSATNISYSYWTGSASNSIVSAGSVNSTAAITGPKLMPYYQGNGFLLTADNYYIVIGMHSLSAGVNPIAVSHAVQGNTYANEWGRATTATTAWRFQVHGAFSSTSSTNAGGANQWLMPSAIATTAITQTANAHDRPFPIMFQCGHN